MGSASNYRTNLHSVTFELQEPHDLNWLTNLGEVFCVFDRQDSGNICFGLNNYGRKLFVKYAGARPLDFSGDPQDAITRLKNAIPIYAELAHPHLTKLVQHFQVEQGYAAVFEWFEGECLHSHWSFAGWAKYNHPDSPFFRFKQLPVIKRLKTLDVIITFFEHVESKGYVAVDFYDGSILYDFIHDETKICDIDFYRKKPTFNDLGEHFWGAARSKAPEEFVFGAPIDSKTNVFTIGAIAFGLLGAETDHAYSKWDAGQAYYDIALRAVNPVRELRYESVAEFKQIWDSVVKP